MNSVEILSMFFLGLSGTGHCIGMCGPLVVAIPGRTQRFSAHLLYHSGRTVTYTIAGGLMGGIGTGIAGIVSKSDIDPLVVFSAIQVIFSLIAAGFLFWFGLSRIGLIREPSWMSTASPDRAPGYQKVLHLAFVRQKMSGIFLIGILMGMLPCGLSFAAFARALAAACVFHGGLLVFAFSLGTIPGLLLIGTGASGLFRTYRKHLDILSGILMIAMGFSLAADGVLALFG